MTLGVPRYVWIAVLVGIGLSVPSLATGFYSDDYTHLLVLEGHDTWGPQPHDLYRFLDGNAKAVRFSGPFPWWTDPQLRLAFMRPVASGMFMLDHALFGLDPVGYHVHTLLWYAALLATVSLFFGRLLRNADGRAPALAALVFAVDEAHSFPVGWLAARYIVVVTLFMVLLPHEIIAAR